MRIWRISNYADLTGRGGLISSSRWNPLGIAIVYCADHPASALLEMIVHIDLEDFPSTFQLLEIEVPDGTPIHKADMPENWKTDAAITQEIGQQFIVSGEYPVLAVPSVIVPHAQNYLLNPALLDTASIRIIGQTRHPIDPRLLA